MDFHDKNVRNVRVHRLQCDEIRSYVSAKPGNLTGEKKQIGWGEIWTWVALDADTKLCLSYLVGGRDGWWAREFMNDCAKRIRGRIQVTTEGHRVYLDAVEDACGADVDYARLQKIYGAVEESKTKVVSGRPDPHQATNSYPEQQNLAMRKLATRFPGLTNAFSKKLENHSFAVALHFVCHNFVKIHSMLKVTPAVGTGLADHQWSLEELDHLLSR